MSSVVNIYADGYCNGVIDVYNSDGDLLLEGKSPITMYVPAGSSGTNSVDSKSIDHFEIPTKSKAKLTKVTDGTGSETTSNNFPYSKIFSFSMATDNTVVISYSLKNASKLANNSEIHLQFEADGIVVNPCNVTYQLGNCSSSLTNSTVPPNKEVSITLTANVGYEFTTTPTIVHNTPISFTVSNDKKTANVKFTPTTDFIVSGSATKIGGDTPITKVSRFIDVYLPDSSQLDQIKQIRWITASGSTANVQGNDINSNISAMYQTFIKIPSTGVKNCKIAGYDTNISIPYTDSILTDINSKEVIFEEKYNSAMDYEPHTQCKIYLPFCGIFSIPTNFVIGKTLQLVYSCNLYTCDCECRIYSDRVLVQSESGKFGFEYPFRTIERTNIRVESSNYFSDLVPKVIITRHNFVSLDDRCSMSFTTKTSNIKGYFEADSIRFDIESLTKYPWITKEDIDHIESALREGVVKTQ